MRWKTQVYDYAIYDEWWLIQKNVKNYLQKRNHPSL